MASLPVPVEELLRLTSTGSVPASSGSGAENAEASDGAGAASLRSSSRGFLTAIGIPLRWPYSESSNGVAVGAAEGALIGADRCAGCAGSGRGAADWECFTSIAIVGGCTDAAAVPLAVATNDAPRDV